MMTSLLPHRCPTLLVLCLVLMSQPAWSQSLFDLFSKPPPPAMPAPTQKPARPKASPPKQEPQPEARDEAEAPYEGQLLRLSEIMGSLAYLRDLCGTDDGEMFHTEMSDLLQAESGSEARRDRLAGAYNKGFTNFETVYHSCTANAQNLMGTYLREGHSLAHDIVSRFGG